MYTVIRRFRGYRVGQVINIANPRQEQALLEQGCIVPADHPLFSPQSARLDPTRAGLLYQLAQSTLGELETAVDAIDDTAVLEVALQNDDRAGAQIIFRARLAALGGEAE